MVSWSCLKQSIQFTLQNRKILQTPINGNIFKTQLRKMAGGHDDHHHHLEIDISRFHWKKFKDLLHFYVMLGVIPITVIILYANIFVGPAQLEALPPPENHCQPKYWQYHKHPITRFISRYLHHAPQQDYEKYLHYIYEENEKRLIRNLEAKIRDRMSNENDYKAWSYRPMLGKYLRVSKEVADELEQLRGTN